jgi:endonuclease YncB( thermonuclease family)
MGESNETFSLLFPLLLPCSSYIVCCSDSGKVIRVLDGDTIEVLQDNNLSGFVS